MPIDRALEKNFDFQLTEGMPDCRLRMRESKQIRRGNMWWDPVYCASCSKGPFGLCTADAVPFIYYVCDECASKNGAPPGAEEVPAEELAKVTRPIEH